MRSLRTLSVLGLLAAASCGATARGRSPISTLAEPRLVAFERGEEVAVRWLSLTSCDSENHDFVLCFEPLVGGDSERNFDLRLGDWAPNWGGGHRLPSDAWHHHAGVFARDVDRISVATGLVPVRYVRRDVSLTASFALERSDFAVREPVRARIEIANHGDRRVQLQDALPLGRGAVETCWRFVLLRDGRTVQEAYQFGRHGAGTVGVTELAAGARIEATEDVDLFFVPLSPGEYEASAEYRLTARKPLPVFSSSDACPWVAERCAELFTASLTFTVHP